MSWLWLRCALTPPLRSYTGDEDFADADAVFDCIGDKGAPARRGGGGVLLRAGTDVPGCSPRAGSERFSLHDLTTPGSFWLNPPTPK